MRMEKIFLGHAWATALENAVAYVRGTIVVMTFDAYKRWNQLT